MKRFFLRILLLMLCTLPGQHKGNPLEVPTAELTGTVSSTFASAYDITLLLDGATKPVKQTSVGQIGLGNNWIKRCSGS